MRRTKRRGKSFGITIKNRKAKARELQNWVCVKISAITGLQVGKDQDIASREMGQSGVDIRLTRKALKHFPFSIECKRQEAKSVPFKWIKQAIDNRIPGTDWMLIVKRSHENPIVILDAEQYFHALEDRQNEIERLKEEWGL